MIEWNLVTAGFVAIYILQVAFDLWMDRLNLRHMKRWGPNVLRIFEGFIDSSRLSTITAYSVEKSRLGALSQLVSDSVLLGLIIFGFLAALDRYITGLGLALTISGLLFFFVPGLFLFVVDLPFDYYHTFVLEEKFGFNMSTLRIWIADHLKAGVISAILFSVILAIILWIIRVSPERWWLWGFVVISAVEVLLAVLYPKLIAPLFNKFEPVQDELLAKRITRLMEDNGIKVKKILQMNAGVRSRHTNAYFTGIGKTKQIVLYDTLIETHPHDEILSVLAHEVGHFRGRHVLKQLIFFEISMLIGFYLTYLLLDWPPLYSAFGFDRPEPYVGLFLIGIFWQKAGFFLQPIYMTISRRFERQADTFAARLLGTSKPLISALKRMAAENLSNLAPHPLYVWFNYSHPPLVDRISLLERLDPDAEKHETDQAQSGAGAGEGRAQP